MNFVFMLSLLFPSLLIIPNGLVSKCWSRMMFTFYKKLGDIMYMGCPVGLAHERVDLNERNVSVVLDRLVACLRACASPGIAPLVRLFFGK